MSKPTPPYTSNALAAVSFSGGGIDSPISCAAVNDFVVIAGTGGSTDEEFQIRWCAIGDPTDWPSPGTDDARSKQAGEQTFPSQYGAVTAVSGNDFYGYVFQERAITKMTYVGGDVVFAFDTFAEGIGCHAYNRRVRVDDAVYFESQVGYHKLENDQIFNIGQGRVDKTYTPTYTNAGSASFYHAPQEAVVSNEALRCVFFENQNLCYNYATDQWSRLPAYDGATFVNVDSETEIVGRINIPATGAVVVGQSGGALQTATLETGAVDINQFGRTVVKSVRPLTPGDSTVTCMVGVQDLIDDAVSWTTGTAINSRTGYSHLRTEGRYVRVKIALDGGFNAALGVDVEYAPQGKV